MASTVDRELSGFVGAAARGDEGAFAHIVAAHHEDMRRVCAFMAQDDTLADDAVQQAWIIAWRKLGSLRDPARLRPWLVSIAANEARKLLNRRGRRAQVEVVADEGRDTPIAPAGGVDIIDLRVAMGRLDPDDRALLAMRYGAGFNATELSAAVGISPSGIRNRLERLLARLRQELE